MPTPTPNPFRTDELQMTRLRPHTVVMRPPMAIGDPDLRQQPAYLWVQVGADDALLAFHTLQAAAEWLAFRHVGEMTGVVPWGITTTRHIGGNRIRLYWGDACANGVRELDHAERRALNRMLFYDVPVVFRRFKDEGDIIALLPTIPAERRDWRACRAWRGGMWLGVEIETLMGYSPPMVPGTGNERGRDYHKLPTIPKRRRIETTAIEPSQVPYLSDAKAALDAVRAVYPAVRVFKHPMLEHTRRREMTWQYEVQHSPSDQASR